MSQNLKVWVWKMASTHKWELIRVDVIDQDSKGRVKVDFGRPQTSWRAVSEGAWYPSEGVYIDEGEAIASLPTAYNVITETI